MMKFRRAAGAAALIFVAASVCRADPVEDFYRGRTVNLYIGFTPGGGYDLYARMLARHLGPHIPGAPNVIAVNMPGAASMSMRAGYTARRRRTAVRSLSPHRRLQSNKRSAPRRPNTMRASSFGLAAPRQS
jgi:tripartite-type tricarboxylate transporter receptor subunit TctC